MALIFVLLNDDVHRGYGLKRQTLEEFIRIKREQEGPQLEVRSRVQYLFITEWNDVKYTGEPTLSRLYIMHIKAPNTCIHNNCRVQVTNTLNVANDII